MQENMATAVSDSRSQITVQTLSGWKIALDEFHKPAEHTDCGSLLFRFPVTSPCGESATLSVEIPESRFQDDDTFWLMLAEDALTNALEEEGDFPSDHRLRVERITTDQFDLALRWESEERLS